VPHQIDGSVLTSNLEVAMIGSQPAIENFLDIDSTLTQVEGARLLFPAMAGVALDPNGEEALRRHYSPGNQRSLGWRTR